MIRYNFISKTSLGKSIFTIILLVLNACTTGKQIIPISYFNEVSFAQVKPNSLVIFDVDETLIQPKDTYLINEHTEKAKEFRSKLIAKHKDIKN